MYFLREIYTFMILFKRTRQWIVFWTRCGSYSGPAVDPMCTFTTEINVLKLSSRNMFRSSQTLLSRQVFRTEFTCFYSSVPFNCLANPILLGFLNSVPYSGKYNLCNSSICSVFHPTFFFISPDILLSSLLSKTFSLCSCFQ